MQTADYASDRETLSRAIRQIEEVAVLLQGWEPRHTPVDLVNSDARPVRLGAAAGTGRPVRAGQHGLAGVTARWANSYTYPATVSRWSTAKP